MCPKDRLARRRLINAETKASGLAEVLEFVEADHRDPGVVGRTLIKVRFKKKVDCGFREKKNLMKSAPLTPLPIT